MNSATPESRYNLPIIGGIHFSGFDLFRKEPDVAVNIYRSLFCLIGANGLGKSTFLTSLLYGTTGAIPYRAPRFSTAHEYAEEATRLDRRHDYFAGRLSEAAAEHATIGVRLTWPGTSAFVTRRLLGPSAVSSLELTVNGTASVSKLENETADSVFRELVVKESGLPSFDQFIFLMHYVCTFDEDRHLLLWDSVALTNALYLAFGSDAEQSVRASDLKREVERRGSRARNRRFAAKQSLDEAKKLRKTLAGDENGELTDEATLERFQQLNNRLDEAALRVQRKDAELRQTEVIVADRSALLTEFQLEYDQTFTARAEAASIARHHPLVRSTLRSDRCAICANTGVAQTIEASIERSLCPFCGSGIGSSEEHRESIDKLKNLDRQIEKARTALTKALDRRGRLRDDYETSLNAEDAARNAREEFLAANPDADRDIPSENETAKLNAAIKRLHEEAERFIMQSKKEYSDRDRARQELRTIERDLQKRFNLDSERFTALFKSYAEQFVGLTVDIDLEHRKGLNETGFELLLSLEDQARSRAEDVSESQRFFLDIALRMALAEFASSEVATLLIDTPEGSLDITYEARAGQMFSDFVEGGNAILMTANLRSSAMLRRLAESQKKAGMQIERMTDWTDLSDVQRAEEELFTQAFEEIDRALQ